METEFLNLSKDNIASEHLCCIIRSKTKHAGVEAKREWLCERLGEGHVFRKLNAKATVFIEYAPLETAWVPICGENFYYIYCLWVAPEFKGKGYGKALMEYCIDDAKKNEKSGICMLGADKQKGWLSNQDFAKKFGFEEVDSTPSGYKVFALSFDGKKPQFCKNAKKERIDGDELTIFYDDQCPYIEKSIEKAKGYCKTQGVPITLNKVDTLGIAKALPCAFNNYAVFYQGEFKTVNLLDVATLKRILKSK